MKKTKAANALEQAQNNKIIQESGATLVDLCDSKLSVVSDCLADKMKDTTINDEIRYQLMVILGKVLAYPLKNRGVDRKASTTQEQIPALDVQSLLPLTVAEKLLGLLHSYLLKPPQMKSQDESDKFVTTTGKVLFDLSALYPDLAFNKITNVLQTGATEKDDPTNQFLMIENLNLNSKRLSLLLDKTAKTMTQYGKKEKLQILLGRVLRKAIWNWIDHYPMEFVELCQSNQPLPGNPHDLFDTFNEWSNSSTKAKSTMWPLQTLLLILCPDVLIKIGLKEKSVAEKEKFLENLKKALKTGKLAEVAAICFVDMFKASTYVPKSEMSALRHMVPAVEADLTEKLFDPKQAGKSLGSDVEVDQVALMRDCVLSSYRVSSLKGQSSLFNECLKADAPPLFKMVFVQGLLQIATEGAILPWCPTIADSYSHISIPVRSLFLEFVNSAVQYDQLNEKSDKKLRQKFLYDVDVLKILIQLYIGDSSFALYSSTTSANEQIEICRKLLVGLTEAVARLSLPEVSEAAATALVVFYEPQKIETWSTKNVMGAFWEISSHVNLKLASIILENQDIRPAVSIRLFTLIEDILSRKIQFLKLHSHECSPPAAALEIRKNSNTKLETALLMHLCSGDPDICTKAATCLGLLCEEIDIIGIYDRENPIVWNYQTYKKIGSSGVLSTGKAAQQLAIRRQLRKVERPTEGNYDAWTQIYDRWGLYTQVVLSYTDDTVAMSSTPDPQAAAKKKKEIPAKFQLQEKSTSEIQEEWRNLTGFLVALSGVCINKEGVREVESKTKKNTTEKVTYRVIDEFVEELLNHLVTPNNKFVRESIMSLTGTNLTHIVYPVIIRHMYNTMKTCFNGTQITTSKKHSVFVEQSIGMIKHVFDVQQDFTNLSLLTDLDLLIETNVKYVSQLVPDEMSLRIKKITCTVIELIVSKRQYISFKSEIKFKNDLVESLIEWTSDFSSQKATTTPETGLNKSQGNLPSQNTANEKQLFNEVDLEAIKAVSSLLKGLPIIAEGDNEQVIQQKKQTKFAKSFTFFTKLLSRCKEGAKSNTKAEKGTLAEYTIQCLSNLLASNIELGLQYFVNMGYHEDFETRTAFLKVITNILNEGAEFDQQSEEAKYDKLMELIFEPDLSVVSALCDSVQVTEADDVAALLVRLFEGNDKTLTLLKTTVEQEVQRTESSSTLFRRNSMSTKLLAAYTKVIGRDYLKQMLYPVMQSFLSNPKPSEIDPSKLPKTQDTESNADNLIQICQDFYDAITKSLDFCPPQFREVCSLLKKTVHERFPGFEHNAIGGFLFLRFICPAICSPEGFGVINELSNPDLRRALVLVTKVLQNLANGVFFRKDNKESYMVACNRFIEFNMKSINELFDRFATVPNIGNAAPNVTFTDEQRETDIGLLHHHLTMNLEKMGRLLQGSDQNRTAFDRLTAILQKLGAPPEPSSKLEKSSSSAYQAGKQDTNLYEEYMKSHAHLNTEKIQKKTIFYRQGASRDKHPVFYLVARRFNNKDPEIDVDLLLTHILRTIEAYYKKPFVLVVDCTQFSAQNQLPAQWASTFARYFPDIGDNLEKILLINPNHDFKKYSKALRKFLNSKTQKKIEPITSLEKLRNFIADNELGLPPSTTEIEKNIKSSYSPVLKISQYSQKEMTLRVTNDYLQLLTNKPLVVLSKSSTLIDLWHVGSITEIEYFSEEQEITIVFYGGTKPLTIRSPAALQIIERLNASRQLHKLSVGGMSRAVSNPSDVPGTLLNMALLNLGTESELLRIAAYNMLDALCSNFNFVAKLNLLGMNGLSVPTNTFNFIITISEKLAKNHPNLTLEFLLECLQGLTMSKATSALKHLCLDYMRPWLPNLTKYCRLSTENDSAEKVAKTKQLVESLIEFTIHESQITTTTLSVVWETIGSVTDILELVIDCLIKQGTKYGVGSSELEIIGSICITISSKNTQYVAGKFISKLLQMIQGTSQSTVDSLVDHPLWPSITVLIRILFLLSFDNLLYVQQYLPELFHLVMMLFSTGSSDVRAAVHGLFINVVHSLYTLKVSAEDKLQTLSFLLSESTQPKVRLLFGLGGQQITPFSKPNPNEKKLDKVLLTTVDSVGSILYSILSAVSPLNDPVGTSWHARWVSLATQTAFTSNMALQPRACVVLGILCKSKTIVCDDLIDHCLVVLKEALRDMSHDGDDELAVSLIMCLTRLYEYLSPESPYFKTLFWVALSIIQISDVKLFNAAALFIDMILRVQDNNEGFKKGIEACYLYSREGPIDQILAKLASISGMNFHESFSFGIAGHLLKGLKHPKSKENSARVLNTFLDISAKTSVGTNIIGYLAALLPLEGEIPILAELGLSTDEKGLHQLFYTDQLLPDTKHAALLFTFLVTILENTEKQHEQQFIYETLVEGVQFRPDAFCVVEDILFPMMSEVLRSKSQKPEIIEHVQSIMKSFYKQEGSKKLNRTYLNEIGFHKLPKCATFTIDPDVKREITKLVILLLENILKEVRESKTA